MLIASSAGDHYCLNQSASLTETVVTETDSREARVDLVQQDVAVWHPFELH